MSKTICRIYLASLAVMAVLGGCVSVQPPARVAAVAPTESHADAERKLALVKDERARAEARFAAGEQLCYTRFFTNHCLDKVREERRTSLANVRAIEIEAEHYQRQARADERDAALLKSQQEFDAEQARLRTNPPPAAAPSAAASAAPTPRSPARGDRSAEHAARLRRLEAAERAGAAQREANVKAFEARRAASAERLREVERKKAATAKAAAERAAARAAEQATPQPAPAK